MRKMKSNKKKRDKNSSYYETIKLQAMNQNNDVVDKDDINELDTAIKQETITQHIQAMNEDELFINNIVDNNDIANSLDHLRELGDGDVLGAVKALESMGVDLDIVNELRAIAEQEASVHLAQQMAQIDAEQRLIRKMLKMIY